MSRRYVVSEVIYKNGSEFEDGKILSAIRHSQCDEDGTTSVALDLELVTEIKVAAGKKRVRYRVSLPMFTVEGFNAGARVPRDLG